MKWNKKYILIAPALLLSMNSLMAMQATINCDMEGKQHMTKETAKKCVTEKIIGDPEKAFMFVNDHENSKHFGKRENYKECDTYDKWQESFFVQHYFEGQIGLAEVTHCTMEGAWKCFIRKVQGCYVKQRNSKGEKTLNGVVIIDNGNGQVRTMYPSEA